MVWSYKECLDRYGTDYRIRQEISAGRLFQKEKGIYTDQDNCSEIEIIITKYPRAVYTGASAYYYYALTDAIPDEHVLATKRTDTRIKDPKVQQIFVKDELFGVGKRTMDYRGTTINIYSLERLLVDLIRSRAKVSFDYYKEIIESYRRIRDRLDYFEVEEYADKFRSHKAIMDAVRLEVL